MSGDRFPIIKLEISFDGENYYTTVDAPNSLSSCQPELFKSLISWYSGTQLILRSFLEGRITFEEFISQVGVDEETGYLLTGDKKVADRIDKRNRLNRLLDA